MSQTLSIPAQDRNRLHLFALNMIEAEAKVWAAMKDAPAQLLGVPVNGDFAEILRVGDLDDLGLAGYLGHGYDVPQDTLANHAMRLNAVEGYAIVLLSRAFGDHAQEIAVPAELSYLGSYPTEPTDWQGETGLSAASTLPGGTTEPARKRPSDAAMMGRVAMVVLLLMFALTGLVVWIAG